MLRYWFDTAGDIDFCGVWYSRNSSTRFETVVAAVKYADLMLVTPCVSASWAFLELGLRVVDQPPKYALFFKLLSRDCPDLVMFLIEDRDMAREGDANPVLGVETCLPSSSGMVEDLAMVYLSANGLPRISFSS